MTTTRKAFFRRLGKDGSYAGDPLEVQFNPSEFTLSKGAQLAEVPIPGLDSPILQFVRGQNETLTLELFFDSTEAGTGPEAEPVTELTDPFYQLIKIDPRTHAPPVVEFFWGGTDFPGKTRDAFRCLVESVRQRYTLFSPAGVPLRAVLSVTLREYRSLEHQLEELNLQSADHTKAHVTQDGETLSQVAYETYDDPARWRLIADANEIDDPLAVPAGTILEIPRGV